MKARFTGTPRKATYVGKDGEKRGRLRFEPMGRLRCGDGDRPHPRIPSRRRGFIMETRYSTCLFCDGGCTLKAEVKESGSFTLHPLNPASPAICSKAGTIDEYRFHPDRVTRPLKNVGERGEPQWEAVSWDEALDEIAVQTARRHRRVRPRSRRIRRNAPEPRVRRRDAAPDELHRLPELHRARAALHGKHRPGAPRRVRMVHKPGWDIADCIVYFGQDRDEERWPAEYQALNAALERGAKLIVIDPRRSRTSARAHWHLPIRYGTDAALALSWINVIIEEGLFDRAFVEELPGIRRAARARIRLQARDRRRHLRHRRKPHPQTARVYASADAAIATLGHRRGHAGELDLASAGAVHPARHLRLHQRVRKRFRTGARGRRKRAARRL